MTSSEIVQQEVDDIQLQTIEQACARFQTAWAAGQKPELTEFLGDLSGDARRHALCDLLWIEWDHLRRAGLSPQLEDYRKRFADLSDTVDEAWRSDFGRLAHEANAPQTRGGRFTILKRHASGGFGEVYVAHDQEVGRSVALKELRRRHTANPATQERFLREAKITGKLEHPGIVPVYSMGARPDGVPYYAMRFVDGESLKEAITRFYAPFQVRSDRPADTSPSSSNVQGPRHVCADEEASSPNGESSDERCNTNLNSARSADSSNGNGPAVFNVQTTSPPAAPIEAYQSSTFRQLLSRLVQACHVVEYAHSRGVLHRDLKPDNILLGRYGETLVVDWGLSKAEDQTELASPSPAVGHDDSSFTQMSFTTLGALIGTPAYMSPEQAAGHIKELSAASDIYGLGATLYHLLAGTAPLANESRETMLTRIERGDLPNVRTLQPAVPPALDAICRKAMSRLPEDRYQSASQLAADIDNWLGDETVEAFPEPWRARLARWSRKHPTATAINLVATTLIALVSVATAVLIAVYNYQLADARTAAEDRKVAAEIAQAQTEQARLIAEAERDVSKSVSDFMIKCFKSPDPEEDGHAVTVAQLLDRSFEEIKADSAMAPLTKSRLLEALARSNLGLKRFPQALAIADYAMDFTKTAFGSNHHQVIALERTAAQVRSATAHTSAAAP